MSEVPNRPCGCPMNAEHDSGCPGAPRMINRWEQFPGGAVTDLLDWVFQKGLSPTEVRITGGHLKWVSPQTPEEKQRQDEFERERDERTARWEREMFGRLKAKFEGEAAS